jgi:oxygen-independent coproporphyrinogen-3 oxidase
MTAARRLLVFLPDGMQKYRSDVYDMAKLFYGGGIEFCAAAEAVEAGGAVGAAGLGGGAGSVAGLGGGAGGTANIGGGTGGTASLGNGAGGAAGVAGLGNGAGDTASLGNSAGDTASLGGGSSMANALAADDVGAADGAGGVGATVGTADAVGAGACFPPGTDALIAGAREGGFAATFVFSGEPDAAPGGAAAVVAAWAPFGGEPDGGRYALKMLVYKQLKARLRTVLPWGALVGVRPVKKAADMMAGGASEREAVASLAERYDVSERKARLCAAVAKSERRVLGSAGPADMALYVGIPFCRTKCAYCSFPSDAFNKAGAYAKPYLAALKREIAFIAEYARARRRRLAALYIGGGTPTALPPEALAELLECLAGAFSGASKPMASGWAAGELTIEAGRPDTISCEQLECIKKYAPPAKTLRLCVNPQTMNATTLRLIGRAHAPEDAERAFEMARGLGFCNINMDVIAGLPGEDLPMFRHTMGRVAALDPEGITVHTLSVKRSSTLNEHREAFPCPPLETVAAMLDEARRSAEALGMSPYYLYRLKNTLGGFENTGYAKAGRECAYNIHEMADRIDILAAGAGAATKLVDARTGRIERVFNTKNLVEYIERIDEMIERKRRALGA